MPHSSLASSHLTVNWAAASPSAFEWDTWTWPTPPSPPTPDTHLQHAPSLLAMQYDWAFEEGLPSGPPVWLKIEDQPDSV
ncbi:hypothetical protein EW146_g8474 [Bondarzewia mesenterica]|uniref:Uncharacterized protein n=1 Tax=Bondarzewia mesenterica TaxID=1095465 RepID=A0A4S4LE34_9AGAM|nr:hypothetical protein EW146_g8474 [Bondarzewia mesenterica]